MRWCALLIAIGCTVPAAAVDKWVVTEKIGGGILPPPPNPGPTPAPINPQLDQDMRTLQETLERVLQKVAELEKRFGEKPTAPEPAATHYPTHTPYRHQVVVNRGGYWWNVNDPTLAELRQHLKTHPNHAKHFTDQFIDGLSLPELRSLHDDDHDGQVKPAISTPNKSTSMTASNPGLFVQEKRCENGRCWWEWVWKPAR